MLEQIDMTRKMSKEEFKKRMSILEPETGSPAAGM